MNEKIIIETSTKKGSLTSIISETPQILSPLDKLSAIENALRRKEDQKKEEEEKSK